MKNRVTRRQFLSTMSAGAAGLSLPASSTALRAAQPSPTNEEPAIVGGKPLSGRPKTRNKLMSKLYLTEDGSVVPTLCEELTSYRRARKVLDLPSTADSGTLFILARPHRTCDPPLRLSVNGTELSSIQAVSWDAPYCWYAVRIDRLCLRPRRNIFEFWTDAPAMTAWSLAIEAGHPKSRRVT